MKSASLPCRLFSPIDILLNPKWQGRTVLIVTRQQIAALMLMLSAILGGCNYSERKASNEIIAKVEQFKKSTGRLPETLSEIDLKKVKVALAIARRAKIAT